MKKILSLLLLCTAIYSFGGKIDILDPEYQKEIEEYEAILREWKANGGKYEVSVREVFYKPKGKMFSGYPEKYFYKITLPKKVKTYVLRKSFYFLENRAVCYSDDREFSFLSAICAVAKRRYEKGFFIKRIIPIDQKDELLWEKTKKQYICNFYGFLEEFKIRKDNASVFSVNLVDHMFL